MSDADAAVVAQLSTTTITTDTTETTELEKWWNSFLEQKRSDDLLDAELRASWDNCKQRQMKFAREVKKLTELYHPIEQLIHSVLETDKVHRGDNLFREWGKVRRKECLLAYYDNENFRAAYAQRRYLNSATSFLQALVYRIIPETPDVETYLRDHVSRVISIGVGPGPDVAAYLAYARTHGFKQRLVYYCLDQCAGWGLYLSAFDRHWAAEYGVSVWFKPCRFGKREDVDMLPDADMLVFSFSNTALMSNAIWPLLQARYKLIIVLDGLKEIFVERFIDTGFKDFTLTEKTKVYYHFAGLPSSTTNTTASSATTTNTDIAIPLCDSLPPPTTTTTDYVP